MNSDEDQTRSGGPTARFAPDVRPTAYQKALLDYLRTQEKSLWDWFSSHAARTNNAEAVRIDLLKTAYRLDRESAAGLYHLSDVVADRMQLNFPVTLYQSQHSSALNASLAWLPHEAHIVLHGPVQETLTADELSALLAHELGHHELFTIDDGAYLVVEQILAAMISDQAADAPHDRTWRSNRLYTELHCDRRAAEVTGDMHACIRALVKIQTGLKDVSAESYLKQAGEVFSQEQAESEGLTHPELFIRARALDLWSQDSDSVDAFVQTVVEGPLQLKQLDLLGQRRLTRLTQSLLETYLFPPWLRTNLMMGHAQRFFEDFAIATADHSIEKLKSALDECDKDLRQYFCYVLLDFVTCDPDLEEAPLAAAFLLSHSLDLQSEFRELTASELKIGKRALEKVFTTAQKIVDAAAKEFAS